MRISDWSSDVCSSDLKPRASDCDAMLQLGDPTMIAELDIVLNENGDTAVPSAEFPLMMTPRRTNEMMHSIGRQNPKLGGKKSYNPAFLNPSDMKRFGVSAGDIIRIHSLHGEIPGVAEPGSHLHMGKLSMPHCSGPNPDEQIGRANV